MADVHRAAEGDPQRRGGESRPPRFSAAWFAGTDLRVLARTLSERRFYDTLGLAVLGICCLNGFAFALAASFYLHKPAADVWWLGVAWALLLGCAIEPLIYQTATSRRRYLPLVLGPRVALSLLLAMQIGEPLVLSINADDINNYLTQHAATEQRQAQRQTDNFYNGKIATAQNEITTITSTEQSLRKKITNNDFLSSCEAGTPSCSHTGQVGCRTYCHLYRQRAADARAELMKIQPSDRMRIAQLQTDINTLKTKQGNSNAKQHGAIASDTGLPARERALAALERADPSISREAWFLRLLFVALDLIPLTIKVVRMLSVDSPYEQMAAAARGDDAAEVHAQREQARVREHRVTVEAEADIAIDSERARARAFEESNRIWERYRGSHIPRTGRRKSDDEERPAARTRPRRPE